MAHLEPIATGVSQARRRQLLTGVVLLGLGVVITLVVAVGSGWSVLQSADQWWYATMMDLRWGPFVDVSKALGRAFQSDVTWPLRFLVTLFLVVRREWQPLTAWLLTVVVSELCIGPAKAIVDRPRPAGSLIATSGDSYPSGHAIAAAAIAIGIVIALTSGRWRRRGMVIAVLVIIAVALSRPYLSAHWLSDVLGGSLIGMGLALTIPEVCAQYRTARDSHGARGGAVIRLKPMRRDSTQAAST